MSADRIERIEGILGNGDRKAQVLINADPRCLEGIVNPCGVCRVNDMVSLMSDILTAKEIAEICCPTGKMPDYLKRKIAAMSKNDFAGEQRGDVFVSGVRYM